jgi:hypothetical protein
MNSSRKKKIKNSLLYTDGKAGSIRQARSKNTLLISQLLKLMVSDAAAID